MAGVIKTAVVAGLIVAVGISNLQTLDMNSSRNLFIFGFSFFTGLTVSEWMKQNPDAIDTGFPRSNPTNNTFAFNLLY